MKNFACSNFAFAGVLLLALGSTPGTLSGQSQTPDKNPAGSPCFGSDAPAGGRLPGFENY